MEVTVDELWAVHQQLQTYIQDHSRYLEFIKGLKLGVSGVYNLGELDKRLEALTKRLDETRAARAAEFSQFLEYDARMPTDQQFAATQRELSALEDQKNEFARSIAGEIDKLQQKELLLAVKSAYESRAELCDKEIKIEQEAGELPTKIEQAPQPTVWDAKIAELNDYKELMM